jgi:putative transposase
VYTHRGVSLKPSRDIKPLLAVAKKSRRYSWLKEYDSLVLQQAVINLDKAFPTSFRSGLNSLPSKANTANNPVTIPTERY